MPNIFANLPSAGKDELFETLAGDDSVRIERIISHAHSSPAGFWYDQPHIEWVMVLQGAASLQFEDRTLELGVGDYVTIAAHEKHRVRWTTPDETTIWLAVHFPTNVIVDA